jgi:hypothetical protein
MKKSNWREELNAPPAVKKTINEFVVTGAGLIGIAKSLGIGTALKTIIGTGVGKVTLGALGGAALTKATGTGTGDGERKKRGFKLSYPGHDIGVTRNPQ